MIAYLTGTVQHLGPKSLILLTSSGVGYEVLPAGGLLALAKEGKPLNCFIYTVVRETEITLYGFKELGEKEVFLKLLGISGVGPKIALQIVSGPIEPFMKAVSDGDDAFIAQTPGIGKKMAQKIIVELRGKIDLTDSLGLGNQAMAEAVEALKNLGYDPANIEMIFKKAPEEADAETLITYFLRAQ